MFPNLFWHNLANSHKDRHQQIHHHSFGQILHLQNKGYEGQPSISHLLAAFEHHNWQQGYLGWHLWVPSKLRLQQPDQAAAQCQWPSTASQESPNRLLLQNDQLIPKSSTCQWTEVAAGRNDETPFFSDWTLHSKTNSQSSMACNLSRIARAVR